MAAWTLSAALTVTPWQGAATGPTGPTSPTGPVELGPGVHATTGEVGGRDADSTTTSDTTINNAIATGTETVESHLDRTVDTMSSGLRSSRTQGRCTVAGIESGAGRG